MTERLPEKVAPAEGPRQMSSELAPVKLDATNVRRFLRALTGMGVNTYVFDKRDAPTLGKLRKVARLCTRCDLARTRKTVVFGEGDPKAQLVFVGEAPGEDEDAQGRPFVGRAGKLLDQLIGRTGLRRSQVYICNVLKCRPPGNRDPEPTEIEACKEYLLAQLSLIKPRVICTLGRHAYNTLLGVDERITRVRGVLTKYHGITLLPAYHPSFLLRNQGKIKEAWEDMETLKKLLSA
ncbi:MAG TPA: uracil-DNA glycosylase [Syntrophorhabdaceae bacterium]|nr:uracil-DNA glycosylase [Syntrophorhabdaceae bacterium]